MTNDFDNPIIRRGTGSYKWDEAPADDIIPMWVADMDFRAAQPIIDALQRRIDHGVFGYTLVDDEYYKAVTSWFERRHGWRIEREWIQYTSGVVPAVSAVIKALTMPGDKVIVATPVYNCFFSSIRNNGCEAAESPLICRNGRYEADYDDIERLAADPRSRIFLLCNPHNPGGRVWTREELLRINDICMRHGVTVVSDEIHCELVFNGHRYTPFASIDSDCLANSVTCCSPSKAFNTAGLQIANIISSSPETRAKIDRAININEVCDVNPFGVAALKAAYNEGEEWLEALLEYIAGNYAALKAYFDEHLPGVRLMPLEGTYLVWADIRSTGLTSGEAAKRLETEGRVMVSSGTIYGGAGEGYIRINIACPRERMMEGVRRICRVLAE
ncbi:MAG: pyridoxal phosphate-dependent aminotransferase [Prevotella sp.]|nr:pyridoxal phosphate-dependent aminotransferase [Prevotella sp.]